MDFNLKEILDKFGIKPEEFLENIKESLDANSDTYRGLTSRQTKSFYRELSKYYSNKNKTTKGFIPLNIYFTKSLNSEIYFKAEEPEVNQILEGGFKGGYVYQIIGPTGTGKTSLMNSLVKANINNKNIKIIYFSFLYDNVDYDLEQYAESNHDGNLTIVDHIRNFKELLLSEYFKNMGEKLKNYNIIIFDPLTIILHRGMNFDFLLMNEFSEIINNLTWKNKVCVIFGLYDPKLGNTFWYYENDQKQIERLIMRNYENINLFQHFANSVKIYLYKIQKHKVVKYYMKVMSSNYLKSTNFSEWELATGNIS